MPARIPLESAPPFRIKICGVTLVNDVDTIVNAGADAIGLNFYPASSRFVTLEVAKQLRERAEDRLRVVGVWVNESAERIAEIADELALDAVQLHGNEPVEVLRQLADCTVVRAMRHPFSNKMVTMLDEAARLHCSPSAVLIDAAVPGQYGGTGESADWSAVHRDRARLGGLPLILAGGLTAATVSQAIATSGAEAVDVASGVEIAPGVKNGPIVERFVMAARRALDQDKPSD